MYLINLLKLNVYLGTQIYNLIKLFLILNSYGYIFRYSVSDHCNENQEKSDDIDNW